MPNRTVAILLAVFMMLSLGGCGVKEKAQEKISERVMEGVLNSAIEGEGKIDIDGDKVSIKGKDGEEFSFGGTSWPDSGAGKLIPELKKGKVVSVLNSNEGCVMMLEEVAEKDYQQYIEELKDQGFNNDVFEYTSTTGQSYSAKKDENTIGVSYEPEGKTMTINYVITQ